MARAGEDLDIWLSPFLAALGHRKRRGWAPLYLRGLLGPSERKSLQPMATSLGLSGHDQLQHFIASPAWDDAPLWRVPGSGRRPAFVGEFRDVPRRAGGGQDMAGPGTRFVGFYWTLPVPQVGFVRLPEDAEAAAGRSRTIRYQRNLVRRFVAAEGGRLVGEVVWLELAPDRGSGQVETALRKAFDLCRAHGAILVHVEFGQRFGWRAHEHLRRCLEEAEVPCRGLDPEPDPEDGFDPVRHFRRWRHELDRLKAAQPRGEALRQMVLTAIQPHLPPETDPPDYRLAVALLEAEGIRTPTGKSWTRDNLRMFVQAGLGGGQSPAGRRKPA